MTIRDNVGKRVQPSGLTEDLEITQLARQLSVFQGAKQAFPFGVQLISAAPFCRQVIVATQAGTAKPVRNGNLWRSRRADCRCGRLPLCGFSRMGLHALPYQRSLRAFFATVWTARAFCVFFSPGSGGARSCGGRSLRSEPRFDQVLHNFPPPDEPSCFPGQTPINPDSSVAATLEKQERGHNTGILKKNLTAT